MPTYTKDINSSTGIPSGANSPNSATNPEQATYATSATQPAQEMILAEIITQSLKKVSTLEAAVILIEKEQDKSRNFYTSITKLSNTAQNSLRLLMVIPVLQIIACTAVVYHLGILDTLPNLLSWVLGGVSITAGINIFLVSRGYSILEAKVNHLEEKLDSLKDKMND